PWTRDHSATYGDGAYCACNATSFSTAFTAEIRLRSSSICRRSSVRFSSRSDGGFEEVTRRILEQRRQIGEENAVRDEALPRVRSAREEAECRAHRRRRVVKRAANGQLFVVQAVCIDGRARVPWQPAEHDNGAPGPHERECVDPRLLGADCLDD